MSHNVQTTEEYQTFQGIRNEEIFKETLSKISEKSRPLLQRYVQPNKPNMHPYLNLTKFKLQLSNN